MGIGQWAEHWPEHWGGQPIIHPTTRVLRWEDGEIGPFAACNCLSFSSMSHHTPVLVIPTPQSEGGGR